MEEKILRDHLRSARASKPRSLQIRSRDVPLNAPVITSAALYWAISNLSLKDSVRGLPYIISA